MASPSAVGGALQQLAAVYRKEITPQLITIYNATLKDLSDATLQLAVEQCLRTCTFFPNPAELRNAVGANVAPTVDAEAVVDAIRSMGTWNPASGTAYPTGAKVREVFGDGIAAAYLDAGCAKIFSDNEQGREIAQREFRQSLKDARNGPGGQEIAQQFEAGRAEASRISARQTAIRYGEIPPALPAGGQPERLLGPTYRHRGGFKRLLGGESST